MPTLITWNGIPCQSVKFKRTRGVRPDATEIVIPLADLPEVDPARPASAGSEIATVEGRPITGRRRGRSVPLDLASRIPEVGTLFLQEDVDGEKWSVSISPLYVLQADEVRRSEPRAEGGSPVLVRVLLVDVRYFWGRGVLRRWSFNRVRAPGDVALDSVSFDGSLLSLADVAGIVCDALPSSPPLGVVPSKWSLDHPAIEWPRYTLASTALAHLCTTRALEEPCLNLDGSVSLYRSGEGKVGYAPDGKGPGNSAEFDPRFRLSKGGTGLLKTLELTHPPDYVVVVGGQTIRTVRFGPPLPGALRGPLDLEPVFDLDGDASASPDPDALGDDRPVDFPDDVRWIVPLEEGLKILTGMAKNGPWTVEFLNRWILYAEDWPQIVANGGSPVTEGIPDRNIRLLVAQTYRLWRIPGAVIKTPRKPVVKDAVGGVAVAIDAGGLDKPGPNANCLPVENRAECGHGGRRLKPTVESFTWGFRHVALDQDDVTTRTDSKVRELRVILAGLRADIEGLASLKNVTAVGDTTLAVTKRGGDDWEEMLAQARFVEQAARVDGALASRYEQTLVSLLTEESKAGDDFVGVARDVDFKEAQISLASAITARDQRNFLELLASGPEHALGVQDSVGAARARAAQEARQAEIKLLEDERKRRQVEFQAATQTGRPQSSEPNVAIYLKNLPAELDEGGHVYDAEQGVFSTSKPCGWLSKDGQLAPGRHLDVAAAAGAVFVPLSPVVKFGATVRPRLDVPPRVDGAQREASGGGTAPAVIDPGSDQETYFTVAFKRNVHAVERVPLSAVPLDQATRIDRDELVLLVTLKGADNGSVLEEKARLEVAELFLRNERVTGQRLTLGRPWPVNCDGVVASVEITSRADGNGFQTVVESGSELAVALARGGSTVERARALPRPATPDAAERTGVA